MKVCDLIARLQHFDPELPVCIGDWIDRQAKPHEEAGEFVSLVRGGEYIKADGTGAGFRAPLKARGDFVLIGDPERPR